jgi:hypothetical protein
MNNQNERKESLNIHISKSDNLPSNLPYILILKNHGKNLSVGRRE